MKAAGILIIILSFTGMGFSMSMDLRKRIDQMKDLKKMVTMLKGEIKYAKAPLPEAFYSMGQRLEEPFTTFLVGTARELDSYNGLPFKEVWNSHVDSDLNKSSLLPKDKEQLKSLGENMGYLDNEMQQNTIELYLEQLESEIDLARQEVAAKSKVYQCLGIMSGLFVAIILI